MSNVPTVIFSAAYTAATPIVLTTTATATVGQCIYVWVNVNSSGGTAPTGVSCTDDAGNAYSLLSSDVADGTSASYLFVCAGSSAQLTSGQHIQVTLSGTPATAGYAIAFADNGDGLYSGGAITNGNSTALTNTWPINSSVGSGSEVNQYFFCTDSAGGISAPAGLALVASGSSNGEAAVYYASSLLAVNTATISTTGTTGHWTALALMAGVVAPTINAVSPLSSGVQGEAYSQQLLTTGGLSSSYTYSLTGSGVLPTGLSFSGNTIAGTISGSATPGAYTFQVNVFDGTGFGGPFTLTINVVASGTSGLNQALTPSVPGNLLSLTDQSMMAGGSLGWVTNTNTGAPAVSTLIGLDGTKSLVFQSTAAGQSIVQSVSIPCTPGQTLDCGGYVMPASGVNTSVRMGMIFWTGSSWTAPTYGPAVTPAVMGQWVPVYCPTTAPAGSTLFQVVISVDAAQAGDMNHADILWTFPCGAQVLIDWASPAFGPFASGGNYFTDITPWVEIETGNINLGVRGRKDAVSEVSPGIVNFSLLNDTGWFSPDSFSTSLPGVTGGTALDVGSRTQVNFTDPNSGVWFTRFDGSCTGATYDTTDNTGNTSTVQVSASGVLSYLNRQPTELTWTQQAILADGPLYLWPLSDAGSPSGSGGGTAREISGNNYGALHTANTDSTGVATIAWSDTSSGIETQGDASGPNLDTGSEYWSAYRNSPGSLVRGPIPGAVGPYTTPVGSINLTPVVTASSALSQWSGNKGYYLTGMLTGPSINTAISAETDIEVWFTCNPGMAVSAHANAKVGPYIQFCLSGSRGPYSLTAGIFLNGAGGATYEAGLLYQRPGIANRIAGTTAPVYTASAFGSFTPDTTPVPHRLYLQIFGGGYGPLCQVTLDGTILGAFFLPKGIVFDRVTLGAGPDGTGCHYGNISMCAIYGNTGGIAPLPASRSAVHTQFGLYGNFEMTTDDCIAALGQQAQIPPYWSNLSANGAGINLTDYYNINQNNALVNMQIFEQMEMGLLFENSLGQLTFHTGDWRQGYGAPDLQLPQDTFDGDAQLARTVQFMQNAVTVTSLAFTSGASIINDPSNNLYGPYFSNYTSAQAAGNYVASSIQLPLFAWNRVGASMNIAGLQFGADPDFTDFAYWTSSKFGAPWTMPGQLTFDLKTLDPNKLTISALYALDIDSMVVPTGALPKSWPSSARALEWFIEGISETYSQHSRQLQLFCSPAKTQRAWKLGDATYGVLGSTTTVGVSMADVSATEAYGKAVSHDSGRPYWSPDFGGFAGDFMVDGDFTSGGLTFWNTASVTAVYTASPAANCPAAASVALSGWGGSPSFYQSHPCQPNTTYTMSAWVYVAGSGTTTTVNLGESEYDPANVTFIAFQAPGSTTITNGQWNLLDYTFTTGATSFYMRPQITASTNVSLQATRFRIAQGTPGLNNPAANGHGYVGSNEMRGLADSLALKMRPPMLVASMAQFTEFLTTGLQTTASTYDNIYADTEGGMGLMPSFPNWYVVQRAGWYDIDASASWVPSATGVGAPLQMMITVAVGAAQFGSPIAAGVTYSCPLGEQVRSQNHSGSNSQAASTSMYLGMGDAVNIWLQQETTASLATGANGGVLAEPGGACISMVWRGYGRQDNRTQPNSSASSGGSVNGVDVWKYFKVRYNCTATYAYGSAFGNNAKLISTNGSVYQGYVSNAATGTSQSDGGASSQIVFPVGALRTAVNGSAGIVTNAYLTGTLTGAPKQKTPWLVHTLVGSYGGAPGTKKFDPTTAANVHADQGHVSYSGTHSQEVPIPVGVVKDLLASDTCVLIGSGSNGTQGARYSGKWRGGAGSWILTVHYKVLT